MKKQFGLIYKVTNLNNNKIYIGQTIQTLPCRKSKHKQRVFKSDRKTYFYNAIRMMPAIKISEAIVFLKMFFSLKISPPTRTVKKTEVLFIPITKPGFSSFIP